MEQKNGIQLSQAFGAVLTLVLVAILVIISIVIFVSLSAVSVGEITSSVTNESVTATDAGTALATSTSCNFGNLAVTNVTNSSSTVVPTTNYSISAAGLVTNLSEQISDSAAPWLITYTYTKGSEACNASEGMVTEFGNYTSLIGLVGTIIFLGLVIGVLVASFAFGGRREV